MRKLIGLLLDTETANTLDDPLVYDLAFAVIDLYGHTLLKVRIIITNIFYGEADLMRSAYYAEKLPQYHEAIARGEVLTLNIWEARKFVRYICEKYGVSFVAAHNAKFDYLSLNTTVRYLSDGKVRYFLPYGIEWWDTQKMARSTICKQKKYRKFCEENGYTYKCGKSVRVRESAEVLYKYISKDNDFKEAHTALADVEIEAQIMWKCFAQHKKMNRKLFAKKLDNLPQLVLYYS
jgi:hypothetical protein